MKVKVSTNVHAPHIALHMLEDYMEVEIPSNYQSNSVYRFSLPLHTAG